MKKIVLIWCLYLVNQHVFPQNVGIGIASPAFRLDVRGSINTDSLYRIRGITVLHGPGSGNFFTGFQCGNPNTSGEFNLASGIWSLIANTTGSYNSAFGHFAMSNNLGGGNNAALVTGLSVQIRMEGTTLRLA